MVYKSIFSSGERFSLEEYMHRCGIENVDSYIDPTEDVCTDYLEYENILNTCEVFTEAVSNCKKFMILVDPDCDGIVSSSIAMKTLLELGVDDKSISLLFHELKKHGLSDVVDRIPNNVCIVIPDASINDGRYVEELLDKNCYVIIADHHDISDDFVGEIDNDHLGWITNQIGSPSRNGSGSFVMHILSRAMGCSFYDEDLVTFANVADLMDMTDLENRYHYCNMEISNEFLRYLVSNLVRSKNLTPKSIGWSISPKINAVIRLGNNSVAEEVIRAFAGLKPRSEFSSLLKEMRECHKRQKEIVSRMADEARTTILNEDAALIIAYVEPSSFTGLIANNLMSQYGRTVFCVHENDSGSVTGSLRSPFEVRDFIKESGLFNFCEGHQKAAGVGWAKENTGAILEYFESKRDSLVSEELVTIVFENGIIDESIFMIVEDYEDLWCNNLPEPTVLLKDVEIHTADDIILMGADKQHIKIKCNECQAIIWNAKLEDFEALQPYDDVHYYLNIVGTCAINHWKDDTYYQIIIDKYEINQERVYGFEDIW